MSRGKRVAPTFYAFNRITGEIYAPRNRMQQSMEMRRFMRNLVLDFKVCRTIPFAWRFFRTEQNMDNYIHAFCYGQ